jgi:hypothetical protein
MSSRRLKDDSGGVHMYVEHGILKSNDEIAEKSRFSLRLGRLSADHEDE